MAFRNQEVAFCRACDLDAQICRFIAGFGSMSLDGVDYHQRR